MHQHESIVSFNIIVPDLRSPKVQCLPLNKCLVFNTTLGLGPILADHIIINRVDNLRYISDIFRVIILSSLAFDTKLS